VAYFALRTLDRRTSAGQANPMALGPGNSKGIKIFVQRKRGFKPVTMEMGRNESFSEQSSLPNFNTWAD